MPTGVNLNQYAGPGSFIRWHSDNEPVFGPQSSRELIVSLSSGNSVEFMVRRRAPGDVPSSITLDHGDVLVMDGSAQSEYEHCTASGLQGRRVNLAYRWVAQHTASCPQAGVVGCVLPSCAQGLVEPSSRWLGEGENKWYSSWGLVLLLLILVSVLASNWIHTRRGQSSQWSASIPLGGVLPLSGSCPLGWGTALGTVTTSPIFRVRLFIALLFFWEKLYSFFKGMVLFVSVLLDMLVAEWEPTPMLP